jgi:hypothetical protein
MPRKQFLPCRSCRRAIALRELSCPFCGHRSPELLTPLGKLVGALAVAFAMHGCVGGPDVGTGDGNDSMEAGASTYAGPDSYSDSGAADEWGETSEPTAGESGVGDGDGDGDGDETGADTGEMPEYEAIAELRSERPEAADEGAPEDLLVDIANFAQACAEPLDFPECSQEVYWRLSFNLAESEQVLGTYPGEQLEVALNLQSSTDSPCEQNGPFDVGGSVEVVSITDSSLTVLVSGASGPIEVNGEYVVDRC